MREIEFRGWDIEHDCWVYGYYEDYMNAFGPHFATIHVKMDWNLNGSFKVMPESVGQYTGLKDSNGKKIYEGDIILTGLTDKDDTFVVTFEEKLAGWYVVRQSDGWREFLFGKLGNMHTNTIIGNTWENKKTPVKES
jgi:uncharacterized phage protein (TIGR01671 family)